MNEYYIRKESKFDNTKQREVPEYVIYQDRSLSTHMQIGLVILVFISLSGYVYAIATTFNENSLPLDKAYAFMIFCLASLLFFTSVHYFFRVNLRIHDLPTRKGAENYIKHLEGKR